MVLLLVLGSGLAAAATWLYFRRVTRQAGWVTLWVAIGLFILAPALTRLGVVGWLAAIAVETGWPIVVFLLLHAESEGRPLPGANNAMAELENSSVALERALRRPIPEPRVEAAARWAGLRLLALEAKLLPRLRSGGPVPPASAQRPPPPSVRTQPAAPPPPSRYFPPPKTPALRAQPAEPPAQAVSPPAPSPTVAPVGSITSSVAAAVQPAPAPPPVPAASATRVASLKTRSGALAGALRTRW